jgi:hypothetical protein
MNQVNIDWSKMVTAEQKEAERLENLALSVRLERDNKMKDVVNWYQRYEREERQGLAHVLTLEQIDNYATALADLPQQPGFPQSVIWPALE